MNVFFFFNFQLKYYTLHHFKEILNALCVRDWWKILCVLVERFYCYSTSQLLQAVYDLWRKKCIIFSCVFVYYLNWTFWHFGLIFGLSDMIPRLWQLCCACEWMALIQPAWYYTYNQNKREKYRNCSCISKHFSPNEWNNNCASHV